MPTGNPSRLTPYAGAGNHETGAIAYHSSPNEIQVQFRNRAIYLYTKASAGSTNVETMKKLAEQGRGLSTYISQHVHDRYAARLE